MRITYDGTFKPCRWGKDGSSYNNISNTTILQYYNNEQMRGIRKQMLGGEKPDICSTCYYEEEFGKLNGRIRQLNKSAISLNEFELTMRSSPHYDNFLYTHNNHGLSDLSPVDLHIDLGNTCNSACIMCYPQASSRLESDYKKLSKIEPILFNNPPHIKSWTKNKETVKSVIAQLREIPNIKYIHFLGGETLYDEVFYDICDSLIEHGMSNNIIIGTTTNGTIFNERIQRFIENFKEFHLGISIEAVTPLNDYIRYSSKIDSVLSNIDKFLSLRTLNSGLYISLRITPNIFTAYDLDKLIVYMLENDVIAESCNILFYPAHLRMELLPDDIRQEIKSKLKTVIEYYELEPTDVINIRVPHMINKVIANIILEYYNFICNFKTPDNVEESRYNLVKSLKAFESLRNNSILEYAPRYEEFLRNYGY
jgi:MoaA/NifB/PqqE/SkfB family radical SAM enzyme